MIFVRRRTRNTRVSFVSRRIRSHPLLFSLFWFAWFRLFIRLLRLFVARHPRQSTMSSRGSTAFFVLVHQRIHRLLLMEGGHDLILSTFNPTFERRVASTAREDDWPTLITNADVASLGETPDPSFSLRRIPFYTLGNNKDCVCNCSIRVDHTWESTNGRVPSWFLCDIHNII